MAHFATLDELNIVTQVDVVANDVILDGDGNEQEQLGINFDYIESELIAYLSARSIYNLPITFPSTTGVLQPISGGNLYNFL